MIGTRPQLGVGHLAIGETDRRNVNAVLDSGRLTYGPFSRQFERAFAAEHEVRFAAFCNSGTSALQVALHALKIKHGYQEGDEVIVPALTFVSTVNVILQNGLTPVFVDVDPLYFEIDAEKIEDALTERTRAIIPVHIGGQPCQMDWIARVAKLMHIQLLEDSCETMFATYQEYPVGTWGDASCFSTYAAHLLTTGVGGFACTNDPELAVLMRSLMNHGRDGIYLSIDDDKGLHGPALREVVSRRFAFEHVGYSYRATELEAAIGLGQLERWESDQQRRQTIARRLSAGLADVADLQLPTVRPQATHAWMFYPLVSRCPALGLTTFLEEQGIETRPLLPLVTQPIYQRLGLLARGRYPVADHLADHAFYIGCHPGLSDEDVDYMIAMLREGVSRARL